MDTSTNLRVGDILLYKTHGSLYIVSEVGNENKGTILIPMIRADELSDMEDGRVPMFDLLTPLERWPGWEVIGHAE